MLLEALTEESAANIASVWAAGEVSSCGMDGCVLYSLSLLPPSCAFALLHSSTHR